MKTFYTLLALIQAATAQVKGTPSGFAAGTTGGGSATPAAPSSLAQSVYSLPDIPNSQLIVTD